MQLFGKLGSKEWIVYERVTPERGARDRIWNRYLNNLEFGWIDSNLNEIFWTDHNELASK